MDPEKFEELCISYLYNEMNDEERSKFQHLLATDRDSNIRYNAIRRAQSILSQLQKAEPPAAADPDTIRASGDDDVNRSKTGDESGAEPSRKFELRILPGGLWARALSAAAAVLFGLLIFGAVTGLQVRWDDSGFALSMSLFGPAAEPAPPVPTYLLQEETLEQLRRQQEELFSEIMAAEREQQRIMLLETLSEYAEAIETRRMIDMQLIGLELADFQQQTNQQLSQTDRIIYQLIETLSYNQEQQDDRE
jgi:hypothetical protein